MADLWWKLCWFARAGWQGFTHPFATNEQMAAFAQPEAKKWMDRFHPEDRGWNCLKEIQERTDKGEK